MTPRFPNLVIAGVPKAGTTSLFAWLADHPQALGSHEKETYFFADPGSHTFRPDFNAAAGLDAYANAFPARGTETRLLFEASPGYLYSRTALAQIPDLPGAPKVLFVLREPASQIRSVYRYYRDNWDYIPPEMGFDAFLEAVAGGTHAFAGNELAARALEFADYKPWLDEWRERLGPERMKVCTFDDLQGDPTGFMTGIAAWCGIDPGFYEGYAFPRENPTYVPKNRALQRLNIALRNHLPKGRLYAAARRAYRGLNTRAPESNAAEAAAMDRLRRDFAETNQALARAYDLDLSAWLPEASSPS